MWALTMSTIDQIRKIAQRLADLMYENIPEGWIRMGGCDHIVEKRMGDEKYDVRVYFEGGLSLTSQEIKMRMFDTKMKQHFEEERNMMNDQIMAMKILAESKSSPLYFLPIFLFSMIFLIIFYAYLVCR